MRKRNIQKIVRFNRKEAQDLAAKAKKACLSEAGLIRLLIRGYEPKEKPDDRFYDVMRELSSIGNNINQLAAKANTLSAVVLCSRPYPRRLFADACSFYDGRICQCFTAGRLRQDTVGYAFPWCIGKHHLTELGTA